MRYGMLIDLRKCVGCGSCSVACKGENGTPPGIAFNKMVKYEVGKYPTARLKTIPMPCMHCENPPCVKVCPTKASYKREDGLVLIDSDSCIGCRACIIACPYDSRQFLWSVDSYYEGQEKTPFEKSKTSKFQKGTVVKCVFCKDRLSEGLPPSCVQTCLAGCRIYGDLDDPSSEISKLIANHGALPLRSEMGTKPLVYYING